MTTFPHFPNPTIKGFPFKHIDDSIDALAKEMEPPAVAAQAAVLPGEDPPTSRFSRIEFLFKIYKGIRPLLTTVTTVTLLPSTWRAAVSMFISAADAVADDLAAFKAGKDPEGFKAGKDLSS